MLSDVVIRPKRQKAERKRDSLSKIIKNQMLKYRNAWNIRKTLCQKQKKRDEFLSLNQKQTLRGENFEKQKKMCINNTISWRYTYKTNAGRSYATNSLCVYTRCSNIIFKGDVTAHLSNKTAYLKATVANKSGNTKRKTPKKRTNFSAETEEGRELVSRQVYIWTSDHRYERTRTRRAVHFCF